MTSCSDSIISIVTSDGMVIDMNKNKLCSISAIFREMLTDINYIKRSEIRIKENYESFSIFLRFIYGDDVMLFKFRQMLEMYKMSKRYKVEKIEKNFKKKIMVSNTEFATEVYELAVKFSDEELQFHCWKLFREFTDDDVKGEKFIHSGKITIKRFVTCPIYTQLTESALFFGVYRWARMKVLNKGLIPDPQLIRNIMDPFLPNIRFLTLTKSELEEIFKTMIFNEDEINGIYRCCSAKNMLGKPNCTSGSKMQRRAIDSYHKDFMYYHNVKSFVMPNQTVLTTKHEFLSDFTIYELCFLYYIKLPVSYDYTSKRLVTIEICQLIENSEIYIATLEEECNHNGEIYLSIPLMLGKFLRYKLHIKFIPAAIESDDRIYIERDVRNHAFESEDPNNFINKIYFFVKLFF